MCSLLLVVLSNLVAVLWSTPIDNDVSNSMVLCTPDSIMVAFGTRNPFSGRLFVKGMSDKQECSMNFYSNNTKSPSASFTFGSCNMVRSRTLAPQKGMMQSVVVIISFHKIFVTKVDKAYKVQCFYMEADKTVAQSIEVSLLTTDSLRNTGRMPTCVYTVHQGSIDGPPVKFAQVGQPVWHEWKCDSGVHSILVKSCYVDDGQGNKYEMLDEQGCAIDIYILQDLTYQQTDAYARAYVEGHVFKYADKPTVFFTCSIQICNRGEGTCDKITSPKTCGTPTPTPYTPKGKRSVPMISIANRGPIGHIPISNPNELDLSAPVINVLDLDDLGVEDSSAKLGRLVSPLENFAKQPEGVCMSTVGFGFLLTLVICVFVAAAIVVAVMFAGKLSKNESKA